MIRAAAVSLMVLDSLQSNFRFLSSLTGCTCHLELICWGTVVALALPTRLRASFVSGAKNFIFAKFSRLFLGPPNLLSSGYRIIFPQIRKLTPSPLPNVKVTIDFRYILLENIPSWYRAIILKPSGYFTYHWVLTCTNFTFCPQSVFLCLLCCKARQRRVSYTLTEGFLGAFA